MIALMVSERERMGAGAMGGGGMGGYSIILLSRWDVMIFDKDTITTSDTGLGIFVHTLAITTYKRIYRVKVRSK
jgi:hypothetical protein